MNNSPSQKAQRIVTQLAELPTDEQEAALSKLCGEDADVVSEVRTLLGAPTYARQLFDPVVTAAPVHAPKPFSLRQPSMDAVPIEEQLGTQIGPYRLLQLIGEGGFGSVFMAEQKKPVARTVALKIIKLGMDTRAVVARFEQERQALALMDHPNIAKVFDAGATSTGRPYFVMELCRGKPLTEYCDDAKLSIPDRLALFVQVCHAVQHAHSKGLIHRDIKPSNILVVDDAGRPNPKVIDFGIAKATGSKLSDKTVFTEHRQMIGTPAYMSPEQAEGSLDIDTRTDVYALGVLLYESLTGETPFTAESFRTATFADIPRMIREIEPALPSTRLRQNVTTIARVAAQRHTDARKLKSMLRGELDWIVMKAVEKDRARRYDTANSLADDVERYLKGEAVVAAPPSRYYRISKFVKRHKGPVAAAAVVALALIGGLIGTTYGLRQAVLARVGETAAKEKAETEAARALRAEAAAKARAAELKLVSDFQADMLEQIDPYKAGGNLTGDVMGTFATALAGAGIPESEQSARKEAFASEWRNNVNATDAARKLIDSTILKPALGAIEERFKDQPVVDAQLRHTLAEQYEKLGLYPEAEKLLTRALEIREAELGEDDPETLKSLTTMGIVLQRQGKPGEAEKYYRKSLEKLRVVLGNEHFDTLDTIGWLAWVLDEQQQYEEAERLLKETLETSRRVRGEKDKLTLDGMAMMGLRLQRQGRLDEAEPYTLDALEGRREVHGDDHIWTIESLSHLGYLRLAQRNPEEAERVFLEGWDRSRRALGEEHPYTLSMSNGLGMALLAQAPRNQAKLQEAEPYIRDALEKRRRVLGEMHPETLESINDMGRVLKDQGKLPDAEPFYKEALEKSRQVNGQESEKTLAAIRNLGILLKDQGRLVDAEPYYLEDLERSRVVFGDMDPETLTAINNMSALLHSQEKYAEAEPYAREAMEKRRIALGENDRETLISINNLAGILRELGQFSEAERLYREAVEKAPGVLGDNSPTTLIFITRLGGVLVDQRKYADAEELLAPAEAKVREAFAGGNAHRLAALLTSLGTARGALAKDSAAFSAAEANLLEACKIYEKAPGPSPTGPRMSLRALVDFYALWDKADPGKGYDLKAAQWQAKLEEVAPSSQPSS